MNRIKLVWACLREGFESAWFELTYRAPKESVGVIEMRKLATVVDKIIAEKWPDKGSKQNG